MLFLTLVYLTIVVILLVPPLHSSNVIHPEERGKQTKAWAERGETAWARRVQQAAHRCLSGAEPGRGGRRGGKRPRATDSL